MPRAGAARPTLRPWHIRDRRFSLRWRGLDPAEVGTFLDQVATDLATVYAQLAAAQDETQRIKDALRRWQTAQAPSAYELAAADWTGVRR